MKPPGDISSEITFKTARSGGSGGQHVNKVETMVEGYFDVQSSALLSEEQKHILLHKLRHRISAAGQLRVRSQVHRSQLGNKHEVIGKMKALIGQALRKEKKRIATQPSAASRAKRLDIKKIQGEHKRNRRKIRHDDL